MKIPVREEDLSRKVVGSMPSAGKMYFRRKFVI